MVRIVPGPGWAAFVVVGQDPAEALDVGMGAGPPEVSIFDADIELLLVVSLLIAWLPESAMQSQPKITPP